jgi:hypothetical protein
LHSEIAKLKRPVSLLEAFADVRHREKLGLTTDLVREAWHENPEVPKYGGPV